MFIIIKNNENNENNQINNDDIYKHSFKRIKNNIKNKDKKKYDSIINSIKLINLISNISDTNTKTYIDDINKFIKNNTVYIPLGSNDKIIKKVSNSVIIKDSNTKPIILEIIFIDDTKKQILFKKEDIRIDYIICKIILFIKTILNTNNISTTFIKI